MATKKKAAAKKPAPKPERSTGKKGTDKVLDDNFNKTIKSADGKTVPCTADTSKAE